MASTPASSVVHPFENLVPHQVRKPIADSVRSAAAAAAAGQVSALWFEESQATRAMNG